MRTAYNRWLDVKWDKAVYGPVAVLSDARNTVLHGLGFLTRQQIRGGKVGLRNRLATSGATFAPNGTLTLDETFLVNAATTCRAFVHHLDEQVQNMPAHRR